MKTDINPESLFKHISKDKLPPVDSWDPPFCGEIDICIHRDGQWSYNNSPISRIALVKLFARVLKREGNNYFLVTPVEKVQIRVEAEPFLTVDFELKKQNHQTIAFKTNLDEVVIADENHPIKVSTDKEGQPYPIIVIRKNLHALISRSDFYQLVELATIKKMSDPHSGIISSVCTIESDGCTFILGEY